eukprot:COSAG02_NODE_3171_length_7231_cov_11.162507_2_plen_70_part_00
MRVRWDGGADEIEKVVFDCLLSQSHLYSRYHSEKMIYTAMKIPGLCEYTSERMAHCAASRGLEKAFEIG